MARMHSRKKGKSGSTRPTQKKIPSWCRYKSKEVEMLVIKLAKDGNTSSKIGIILRDSYGVPDVVAVANKSITQIMAEKKLKPEIPEDLMALIRKSVHILKHREKNKQDQTSLLGLQLTESKIRRLIKYYKRTGGIAVDWKYDPESIKLYVG